MRPMDLQSSSNLLPLLYCRFDNPSFKKRINNLKHKLGPNSFFLFSFFLFLKHQKQYLFIFFFISRMRKLGYFCSHFRVYDGWSPSYKIIHKLGISSAQFQLRVLESTKLITASL